MLTDIIIGLPKDVFNAIGNLLSELNNESYSLDEFVTQCKKAYKRLAVIDKEVLRSFPRKKRLINKKLNASFQVLLYWLADIAKRIAKHKS